MLLILLCCLGSEELKPDTIVAMVAGQEVTAGDLVALNSAPKLDLWMAGRSDADPALTRSILAQLESVVDELALIAYAKQSVSESDYQALANKAERQILQRLVPTISDAAKRRMIQHHTAMRILNNMLAQTATTPTKRELDACFKENFEELGFAPNASVTVLEFPTQTEQLTNQSRKAAATLKLVVESGEPFSQVASRLPDSVQTESCRASAVQAPAIVIQHAASAAANSVTLVVTDRRLFAVHVEDRNTLQPATRDVFDELVQRHWAKEQKKTITRKILKSVRAQAKVTLLRKPTAIRQVSNASPAGS